MKTQEEAERILGKGAPYLVMRITDEFILEAHPVGIVWVCNDDLGMTTEELDELFESKELTPEEVIKKLRRNVLPAYQSCAVERVVLHDATITKPTGGALRVGTIIAKRIEMPSEKLSDAIAEANKRLNSGKPGSTLDDALNELNKSRPEDDH